MSTKPAFFKTSKLSSAADQLWTASKSGFKADEKSIKLDLGRTLTNEKGIEKTANNAGPSKSTGFIFGSKLSERVIVGQSDKDNVADGKESGESKGRDDSVRYVAKVFEDIKQMGTSSSFIVGKKSKEAVDGEDGASSSKTMSNGFKDSAIPVADSSQLLPKEDEVEIVTGEEGEENIYHTMCKLHSFDIATNAWNERGMCSLRINQRDETHLSYRIVARKTGNKTVILNSHVFPDMVVEKLSTKRVKFSATVPNSEVPILFLATASEYATDQFYSVLMRIVDSKKSEAVRKRKAMDDDENEEDHGRVPRKLIL